MDSIRIDLPAFLAKAADPLPCTTQPCLFHAPDNGRADNNGIKAKRIAKAVDLCLDCPLMLDCRQWARTHRVRGVAGGETEEERAAAGYRPKKLPGEDKPDCGTEAGAKWHRRYGTGTPCSSCCVAEADAHRGRKRVREAELAAQWPPHITAREMRVLEAWVEGKDRKAIAALLGITVKAADAYLYRLRQKFRVQSNDAIVSAARAVGMPAEPDAEYAEAA